MSVDDLIEVTVAHALSARSAEVQPTAMELQALSPSNSRAIDGVSLSFVREATLRVARGSTLEQVLAAAGLAGHPAVARGDVGLGGKLVPLDRLVAPGDRIELLAPLRVDPKEARRLRYQQHLRRYPKKAEVKPG